MARRAREAEAQAISRRIHMRKLHLDARTYRRDIDIFLEPLFPVRLSFSSEITIPPRIRIAYMRFTCEKIAPILDSSA